MEGPKIAGISNDWVSTSVMMHDNELVKGWILAGGDINMANENGNTLLMNAIHHKNDEIARFLLCLKADVNKKGHTGWTAIHWAAAMFNRIYFIDLLLQHGACIRSRTISLETPLHLAVGHQNVVAVNTLLKAKSPLNVVDEKGQAPLDISQKYDFQSITDLLLEAQSRHARARAIAIVFMAVAKRRIHKDLVQPIGWMIWESRNLNFWLNTTDE